jgi:hypothetical protein
MSKQFPSHEEKVFVFFSESFLGKLKMDIYFVHFSKVETLSQKKEAFTA